MSISGGTLNTDEWEKQTYIATWVAEITESLLHWSGKTSLQGDIQAHMRRAGRIQPVNSKEIIFRLEETLCFTTLL